MSRQMSSTLKTAVAAETGDLGYLVALNFSGGTVYLTTAPFDISWNGQTWQAVGGALTWDAVTEGQGSDSGVKMTLSGVASALLSVLLSNDYLHRDVTIYLVHFSGGAILDAPLQLGSFRLNGGFEINETPPGQNPGTISISAKIENKLGDYDITRGIQTNMNSHQKLFAGDTFFSNVPGLINVAFQWAGEVVVLGKTTLFYSRGRK